jgi:hypothetical protein
MAGNAGDLHDGTLPHDIHGPREIEKRTFRGRGLGDVSLQHDLRLGGNLQVHGEALHQGRRSQSVGNAELVNPGGGRGGCGDQDWQGIADADGNFDIARALPHQGVCPAPLDEACH